MKKYTENIEKFNISENATSIKKEIINSIDFKDYIHLINELELNFTKIHRKTIYREEKHILKKQKRLKLKKQKKDEQIYDLYLQYMAQELYLVKNLCLQGFYIQSYALIRNLFETVVQIYYSKITNKNVLYRELIKDKFSIAIKDMCKKLYSSNSKNMGLYKELSKKSHPTIDGLAYQGKISNKHIDDISIFLVMLYYYGFILIFEYKSKFLYKYDKKLILDLFNKIRKLDDIKNNGIWDLLPNNKDKLYIKDIFLEKSKII